MIRWWFLVYYNQTQCLENSEFVERFAMLSETRKRQRIQGDEDDALLMPQAKRSSTTLQFSEGSREAWESESSSSDSSGVGSPEHAAGTSSSASSPYGAENLRSCSPHNSLDQSDATSLASYEHINRVLREAHFQSLHNRAVYPVVMRTLQKSDLQ